MEAEAGQDVRNVMDMTAGMSIVRDYSENDADDVKGPNIPCSDCHNTSSYPDFADGTTTLAATTVCDSCHSQNGAFDGVDTDIPTGSIGAKDNWSDGVYQVDGTLTIGKEKWCAGCHDDVPANSKADGSGIYAPNIAGDNITFGFYLNGHKSSPCTDCHDMTQPHIDGEARTYEFDSAYYDPAQSGVAYAVGYRLKYIGDGDGEVPLMIPANFSITFNNIGQTNKDNAFRLCFNCHNSSEILDDDPLGGPFDTNFEASLPNPPRDYSLVYGNNDHVTHIMQYTAQAWDSDWDTGTTGTGGSDGRDSLTACSSCHNVHGAAGTEGSTNEPMIRDGSLAGRAGYGFSYVIEDVSAGGYPMVTSTGATQSTSVGAIFRNCTANNTMCFGCHELPPPAASSYNAETGAYLEYYRPWQNYE
jgi:hypothetical protein